MNTFKMSGERETRAASGVMLPVVELVIAIGLFTVISIFIVRFFTSANTISRQADELSKGLIKAESAMELSKTFSPEEVAKELGGKLSESKAGKLIEIYYDKTWNVTDIIEESEYVLSVGFSDNIKGNGVLSNIDITVNKNDKINHDAIVITSLKGAKYIKGGR